MDFRRAATEAAAHFARAARADAPFYLAILAYTAAGLLLLQATGAADRTTFGVYVARWTVVFAFFFPALAILGRAAMVIHRVDRRRALAFRGVFSPQRIGALAAGVALLMALMLFQGMFTSIKNALPLWQDGFRYDAIQADIDRWLHFGVDPWQWLYAFAAHHGVRTVIEWNYNTLWFVFCFGALFFVVTSPAARAVRGRYLACFMLVWFVCGNVIAGLFLSAGPAFHGAVTGDEGRFAEQLAFLAAGIETPGSAAIYQDYLWRLHEAGMTGFGSGISAFPSVHVALVAMNAFFIADYSRRLALAAYAYLALIVASSVYLAWHYAIDGYASIVLVWVIHQVARRAAAPRAATRPAPAPATLTAS